MAGGQPAGIAADLAFHGQGAVTGLAATAVGCAALRTSSAAGDGRTGAGHLAGLTAQGGAGANVCAVSPGIGAQDACSVLAIAD